MCGKTALVDTFEAELPTEGVLRARGQCLEHHGSGEAYLPMLEALGQLCRGPHGGALIDTLRQHAPSWLAHLPWALPPDERRALLRDALGTSRESMQREMAEALEVLSAEPPLVVTLEDLHWSDASSVDLLARVAHRRGPSRLMIVATYRPVELVLHGHPLKALKQRLDQQRLCQEIRLPYLSAAHVGRYLDQRLQGKQVPDGLVDAIIDRTSGNALFVVNLVDDLLARRWLVLDAAAARLEVPLERLRAEVPEGVRQMIESQVDRLSPSDTARLEAASVVGEEFSSAAVAAVLDEPLADIERFCDGEQRQSRYLHAHGVISLPGGVVCGQYHFSHALYRDVFYQRMGTSRRVVLHRRLGEWLEGQGGSAAELARHFVEAATAGCVEKAVEYSRQAAERAAALFAYTEAAQHYQTALDVLADNTRAAERRGDLLVALGHALERSGHLGRAADAFTAAAGIGRASAAPQLFARAVLGLGRGHHLVTYADHRLIGLLEEALQRIGDAGDHVHACILARLDTALSPIVGTHVRREQLREQALALARRLDDPETWLWVLQYIRWGSTSRVRAEELRTSVDALARLAERAATREQAMHFHLLRIASLNELGDVVGATRALAELSVLADAAAIPWFQWFVLRLRTMMALQAGEFSVAKALAEEALRVGESTDHPNVRTVFQAQSASRGSMQGRFAEVEPRLAAFVEAHPQQDVARASLAHLYMQMGDRDAARRHFERLARNGFTGIPQDSIWLLSMARLAEVCAALADRPRAALLYEMLAGYMDRIIGVGGSLTSLGHGSRYLALLAQTLGRWDEAAQGFAQAIGTHTRIGARPWLVYTLVDRAGMLLRQPLKGSAKSKARRQAAEDLQHAAALARAGDMQGVERQISVLRVL